MRGVLIKESAINIGLSREFTPETEITIKNIPFQEAIPLR